jgi:hypothetical protein
MALCLIDQSITSNQIKSTTNTCHVQLRTDVQPIGWGESHELGHNMQMWGLSIGYGATADGNSYAAYTDDTSGENSNNIFPYNIIWVSVFHCK